MIRSTIYLHKQTGLGQGNYIYWDSQQACDAFFMSKTFVTLNEYSVTKLNDGSGISYIHCNLPYDESTTCDYLTVFNSNNPRAFHCIVVKREYVNENTTKLYFATDPVATFWDTIEIEPCLVLQSHVSGDESENFNPEHIPIKLHIARNTDFTSQLDSFNNVFKVENGNYYVTSYVDDQGNVENIRFNYQAGSSIPGFVYGGGKEQMEKLFNSFVRMGRSVLSFRSIYASAVSNIFFAPKNINVESSKPIKVSSIHLPLDFSKYVQQAKLKYPCKKLETYFGYLLVSNSGSIILNNENYGAYVDIDHYVVGGRDGFSYLKIKTQGYENNYQILRTQSWPSLGIGYDEKVKASFVDSYYHRSPPTGLEKPREI